MKHVLAAAGLLVAIAVPCSAVASMPKHAQPAAENDTTAKGIVSIQKWNAESKSFEHVSGGILIKKDVVLTVYSFFSAFKIQQYRVVVNALNLTVPDDTNATIFKIEQLVKHENFTESDDVNAHHNLALLKLDGEVDKPSLIVVNDDDNCPGLSTKCKVYGWGPRPTSNVASEPQRLMVKSVPMKMGCDAKYDIRYYTCAGPAQCNVNMADLASAMICKCDQKNVAVAFGNSNSNCALPVAYTRLSFQYKWIRRKSICII